jgi:UrcA family protein
MKTLAIGAATLALAFTTSPALAGSSDLPTKGVDYSDLNLNSPQGQARLEQRIESAARKVCRDLERSSGTRIRSHEHGECLANARASAKKQMATILSDQRRGG